MPVQKKGGLGKGLGALFSEQSQLQRNPIPETDLSKTETMEPGQIRRIPINDITPNRKQPRKQFDPEKLEELAESIRSHGLIQPIVVRPLDPGYEIIAGERRWRASRLAGLSEVPCILREKTEQENMMVALVENLQRENLNPMEEADAFAYLAEEFQMTHEAIAQSIGKLGEKKSRSYITNALRLRELPEKVRENIAQGQLSAGHGRALLHLTTPEDQTAAAEQVLRDGLSVRQTEELVKHFGETRSRSLPKKTGNPYRIIETELKESLGATVKIRENNNKGSIQLAFYSREELERLLELLSSIR